MNMPQATSLLIPLAPLLPLAAALLAAFQPARTLRPASVLAVLPALALALLGVEGTEVQCSSALFGLSLALDPLARMFLLFTALLWGLAALFARGYVHSDQRLFAICFHMAMAGNIGLLLAQDAPGFYLFFALMSFASYGLVVHRGDTEAKRAGRVYASLVVVGEVLLFTALALAAHAAQSVRIADLVAAIPESPHPHVIVALLFFGFGAKAGALPLHVWLPLAHPAAPTPASAVLSGAMIKAGLIGWLRFLPLGAWHQAEWGAALIALGLAGAFGAVVVGSMQQHPKTVLAYSSISQMGLILVLVGVAFFDPLESQALIAVAGLMAMHHAFSKSALFLSTGLPWTCTKGSWLRRCALLLPALALCGFPFTSGYLAKTALKKAAAMVESGPFSGLLAPALMLSSVGTALLMARFFVMMDRREEAHGHVPDWRMNLAWWLNVALVFAAPVWLFAGEGMGAWAKLFKLSSLAASAWPVPLALLLAWPFLRRSAARAWRIPAGDLLAPMLWLLQRLAALLLGAGAGMERLRRGTGSLLARAGLRAAAVVGAVQRREHVLSDWPVFGTLFVGLMLGLFLLLGL